jgi:uncharacterized protein with HEPN domain
MNGKPGDLQRLQHIIRCISDLEEILKDVSADSFYRNTEKKYAVERVLEIIGEAVNKVSAQTLAKSNLVIPWQDIVDFRNLVTHEYFRVDYTMVYTIATEEIPKVKTAIQFIIDQLQK